MEYMNSNIAEISVLRKYKTESVSMEKTHLCLLYPILLCFIQLFFVIPAYACPSVCYCAGPMVDCYDRGLTEISDSFPVSAVYMNLKRNQIKTISSERLSRLSKVQNILLGKNEITMLQPGSLANIISLKQLDLSSNQIREIHPDAFQDLPNIQVLNLNGNQLDNVDDCLSNLSTLERLDLSFNRLHTITDDTFSGLKELTYLSLSGNQISSLSNFAFAQLTKLSHLLLNKNPLPNVDSIWHGLSTLSSLDLSSCQLTKLPTALPSYLRLLQLSNNSLTYISEQDLSQTRYLGDLYLDDNEITTIEDSAFTHTPYLSKISLNNNKLRMLPSPIPVNVSGFYADDNKIQRVFQFNFDHDSKMTSLSLRNNSIEALAANTFSRLANLITLYLDNNKIKVMYQMAYSRLRQLRSLGLDSNPIREIEKRALGGLSRLTRLGLSEIKGKITNIQDEMFRDVPSLINLDLQGSPNLVACILNNTNVLGGLRSIKYLNLMNSDLNYLNDAIETWLPKLRSIRLTQNPWRCDDKLIPLRKWMERSPRKFKPMKEVVCQYPNILKGTPVIEVAINQFTPTTPLPTTVSQAMTSASSGLGPNTSNLGSTTNGTDVSSISIFPNINVFSESMSTQSLSIESSGATTNNKKSTSAPPLNKSSMVENRPSMKHTSDSTHFSSNAKSGIAYTLQPTSMFVTKTTKSSNITNAHSTISDSSQFSTRLITSQKVLLTSEKISYSKTSQKGNAKSSTAMPTHNLSTTFIWSKPTPTKKNTNPLSEKSTIPRVHPSITRGNSISIATTIKPTDHVFTMFPEDRSIKTTASSETNINISSVGSTANYDNTSAEGGSSTISISTHTGNRTTKEKAGDRDISIHSNGLPKSSESRLPAVTSSSMNGKTKAIIIGISTSVICLVIAILIAVFIIRYKKQQKRIPIDESDSQHSQSHDNVPDTVFIVNQKQSPRTQSQMNTDKSSDITNSQWEKSKSDSKSVENKKSRSGSSSSTFRFGMNCFSPQSQDDSEMLMYSWEAEQPYQ